MRNPFEVRRKLVRETLIASILFLAVPLGYVFLMLCINVAPATNSVEIYVRNISSVVAIVTVGIFLDYFRRTHETSEPKYMKRLKQVTVYMGIAALIKVLISIYYLIYCIKSGNIILLFYVGEILVWSSLALFSLRYYKRMNDN